MKDKKVILTPAFFDSFKKNFIDIKKPWKFYFWIDIYYDLKWYFWAIRHYHKIVKKMRPWDGAYIYEMVKFQLELLLPKIENGPEEEKSRDRKIKNIKRLIELLNNSIEDNYYERCGYDNNYDFKFEKCDNGYQVNDTLTSEQKENNDRAVNEAYILQKKELKEIGQLFSKILEWWN